jgi:hypothetical protein
MTSTSLTSRVDEEAGPILLRIRRAPSDVACAHLVEMLVVPAHGRLDCEMQAVETNVEGGPVRRRIVGATSSSVILTRAMVSAHMPRSYDASSR